MELHHEFILPTYVCRYEGGRFRALRGLGFCTHRPPNANVEWELIAGTWSEIAEFEISIPILELDSSMLLPEEMVVRVKSWVDSDFTTDLATISNAIDWIS